MEAAFPNVASSERTRDLVTGFMLTSYSFARLDEVVRIQGYADTVVIRIVNEPQMRGSGVWDFALWSFGRFISDSVRDNDLVCRFGEAEFFVVLSEASPAGWIVRFCDRLARTRLAESQDFMLQVELGAVRARHRGDVLRARLLNSRIIEAR